MNTKPIIIEFAGMPKSGKDKLLRILDHYFRRKGLKVKVFRESARACPFDKKHHPEYSYWGIVNVVKNLLEDVYANKNNVDIIFLNRGLFDALGMLKLLNINGEITAKEYATVAKFIYLERWANLIHSVFLFYTPPEVSLRREYKDKLIKEHGRIMNQDTLSKLEKAYDIIYTKFNDQFREIVRIDTTASSVKNRAKLVRDHIWQLSKVISNEDSEEKMIYDSWQSLKENITWRAGKSVLIKGAFDILHSDHVDFINKAKSFGDYLIVALLTDQVIKRKKGDGRPINPLNERIKVMSSLKAVNYLTYLDNEEPNELIMVIQPNFFVTTCKKYKNVNQMGKTRVKVIPRRSNNSSTSILKAAGIE